MHITYACSRILPGRWRLGAALDNSGASKAGRRHKAVPSLIAVVAVFFGGLTLTDAAQAAPEMGVAYHIKFRHSNKCLNVPYGTPTLGVQVQQYSCVSADSERWRLEPAGTDVSGRQYYLVRNAQSDKCLNDTDWSLADWGPVTQYTCGAHWTSEWFALIRSSDMPADYYKLMNYHSEKCVNVPYGSWDDNLGIIQYACDGYWPQGTENMQVRFFRFP